MPMLGRLFNKPQSSATSRRRNPSEVALLLVKNFNLLVIFLPLLRARN